MFKSELLEVVREKVMVWSNEQLLHWHRIYEEYKADASIIALHCDINLQRQCVQQEILDFLNAFLAGEITLKAFNTTFQQKTHGIWNTFHIRGTSGGMFLNKLVKYISDEDYLTQLLRVVLRLPKDIKEGQWRMHTFVSFLERAIASGQATRFQLQPARIPFFLSVWWHLQAVEQWPILYPTTRSVIIGGESDLELSQDPVERYFTFRTRFVSLADELRLTSWEVERLLTCYSQKQLQISTRKQEETTSNLNDQIGNIAQVGHTDISPICAETKQETIKVVVEEQKSAPGERYVRSCNNYLKWLLAKLGSKIGCQVWIRAVDHRKTWQNERLGTLSIPALPTLAEPSLQQVIGQIDVLWLLNNKIVAAYEIEEERTDVSIGLLRLLDVSTLATENMRLCMVIPQDRFEKVYSELQRPIFQKQNHQQQCQLINQDVLLQNAEHILRWARNLFVVDDLTSLSALGEKNEASVDYNPADNENRKIGA